MRAARSAAVRVIAINGVRHQEGGRFQSYWHGGLVLTPCSGKQSVTQRLDNGHEGDGPHRLE